MTGYLISDQLQGAPVRHDRVDLKPAADGVEIAAQRTDFGLVDVAGFEAADPLLADAL